MWLLLLLLLPLLDSWFTGSLSHIMTPCVSLQVVRWFVAPSCVGSQVIHSATTINHCLIVAFHIIIKSCFYYLLPAGRENNTLPHYFHIKLVSDFQALAVFLHHQRSTWHDNSTLVTLTSFTLYYILTPLLPVLSTKTSSVVDAKLVTTSATLLLTVGHAPTLPPWLCRSTPATSSRAS